MKRLCMERNSTTGGGLMKRNNVNRVLLNDFLGADYTDYSVDTNTLNVTFLRQKNPCNPRLKNRSIEPYLHYSAS